MIAGVRDDLTFIAPAGSAESGVPEGGSSGASSGSSSSSGSASSRSIRCGGATCRGDICCFGSTSAGDGYCSALPSDCGADAADGTRPITCDELSDCPIAGQVCCYQYFNGNANSERFSSATCVARAACDTAHGFVACDPYAASSQCGVGQLCRPSTIPVSRGTCIDAL